MKVLLVDDHAPTRQEMLSLVNGQGDMEVVGEADSGENAIEQARALQPDVIVMDILLPGITGVEATRKIVADSPQTKVVALSNHSGRRLVQAVMQSGGLGYVRKDHAFEELIPAIRSVSTGDRYLGKNVED
jgi:DNA-binding NarL/FixJ family response regulator